MDKRLLKGNFPLVKDNEGGGGLGIMVDVTWVLSKDEGDHIVHKID